MKLPKQLKIDNIEEQVLEALQKNSIPLYENSEMQIPLLKLTPELRQQIFYAKSLDELIFGYETIAKELAGELKGLQNVNNQSDRISRLLIISNDGSKRFYREFEFLLNKHGERILLCRLDVDSELMGYILGLGQKQVKAIMINRKNSVVNILKAII
jgi:hypothetical protein